MLDTKTNPTSSLPAEYQPQKWIRLEKKTYLPVFGAFQVASNFPQFETMNWNRFRRPHFGELAHGTRIQKAGKLTKNKKKLFRIKIFTVPLRLWSCLQNVISLSPLERLLNIFGLKNAALHPDIQEVYVRSFMDRKQNLSRQPKPRF